MSDESKININSIALGVLVGSTVGIIISLFEINWILGLIIYIIIAIICLLILFRKRLFKKKALIWGESGP